MKTSDLIQMSALVVVGYLAYQKWAQGKQPVSTVTPGTQSSKQIINTPLDPDFGITNAGTWDDSGAVDWGLQNLLDWAS